MSNLRVRRATADDVAVLVVLIDEFAAGHPAERHPRSVERMEEALFGEEPLGHVLIAERQSTTVGFGMWRKTYDLFWSMYGGEGIGLFVRRTHRGTGVACCIVAAMCAEIREEGGQFLQTT